MCRFGWLGTAQLYPRLGNGRAETSYLADTAAIVQRRGSLSLHVKQIHTPNRIEPLVALKQFAPNESELPRGKQLNVEGLRLSTWSLGALSWQHMEARVPL